MTRIKIFLLLSVLLLASLACSIFVGGPDYPDQPIPVSLEALESLNTQVEQAMIAGADSGIVVLSITEQQLTSYLALKMTSQEDPVFKDPQVYLRDGQMKIYGRVERGYLTANVLVALTMSADPNGQPQIEILTADFGPFPAPDGLKQTMTALITKAYTGSLGPVATGIRVENITIQDGLMTIIGQIK